MYTAQYKVIYFYITQKNHTLRVTANNVSSNQCSGFSQENTSCPVCRVVPGTNSRLAYSVRGLDKSLDVQGAEKLPPLLKM